MSFRLALKHCVAPTAGITMLDNGQQVGFCAKPLVELVMTSFRVLETRSISIPALLPISRTAILNPGWE